MLIRPIDRRIHTDRPVDQVGISGIGEHRSQNRIPGAVLAVLVMTTPGGLPRPELLGQIHPATANLSDTAR
jgi:hypothetical protein